MNDKPQDPFKLPNQPIDFAEARARRNGGPDGDLVCVMPVPDDAPAPYKSHPQLGAPICAWEYRDAAGQFLGFVMRFPNPAAPDDPSKKEYRPLTLWRNVNNQKLSWCWKLWPAPRPLFGLDRLAACPDALVLAVEGEKSALAAEKLLPDCVAVTSPGGAKNASHTDWSPLKGRQVTIVPDRDEPGRAFASDVSRILADIGAASIAIAEPPAGPDDGFDLADWSAAGFTQVQAEAMIKAAKPVSIAKDAKAIATVTDIKTRTKKGRKAGADGVEPDENAAPVRERDHLLQLVADLDLWQSPSKKYYARIIDGDIRQNLAIDSEEFRLYLYHIADALGFIVGAQAVETVVKILCSRASRKPKIEPWLRVGLHKGANYIDLGNSDGRNIEIAKGEWSLKDKSEYFFVQTGILQPLPEPEGGSERGIALMRSFFSNISDDDFVLMVSWIMYSLTKRKIYPVMCVHAEQNSGKSTFASMVRSLVDPSISEGDGEPKDVRDLYIRASQCHVVDFDNLSGMPGWFADALCRIATGSSFSTRGLMTNDELFVISLSRPVLLNGIASLTDRADLSSRTVTVRPRTFTPDQTRDAELLKEDWDQARPEILGILLDGVAAGLAGASKVVLKEQSRLAPFEKFAMAALPAIGLEADDFARAFRQNAEDSNAAAFENNILAPVIHAFITTDHPGGWSGTVTELLSELTLRVPETTRRLNIWPKTPVSLGIQFDRAAPLLRSRGLYVNRHHTGAKRVIELYPI